MALAIPWPSISESRPLRPLCDRRSCDIRQWASCRRRSSRMTQIEKPARDANRGAGSVNSVHPHGSGISASQRGLFDEPQAPRPPIFGRRDPITSKLAAESTEANGTVQRQRDQILIYMRTNPTPQTSAVIAHRGSLDRYNVARGLAPLSRGGHVVRGGVRHCAVTDRLCITWRPA
jgi:hypothetical protein